MDRKEKWKQYRESILTEVMHKSEAKSLKGTPADETVCSPYFSQGCVNEDTDLSMINEGEE